MSNDFMIAVIHRETNVLLRVVSSIKSLYNRGVDLIEESRREIGRKI